MGLRNLWNIYIHIMSFSYINEPLSIFNNFFKVFFLWQHFYFIIFFKLPAGQPNNSILRWIKRCQLCGRMRMALANNIFAKVLVMAVSGFVLATKTCEVNGNEKKTFQIILIKLYFWSFTSSPFFFVLVVWLQQYSMIRKQSDLKLKLVINKELSPCLALSC